MYPLLKVIDKDFSVFLNQRITSISSVGKELFNIFFEKGNINVECTWRLRNNNKIVIACSDYLKNPDIINDLNTKLIGREMINIVLFEPTDDLVIEFDNEIYLDLLADSSLYESYQIYLNKQLFYIGN